MVENNINIFALTDSHQEARKLCCLFSGIVERAPQNGRNSLICDCGDIFKGIYERQLCVDSYVKLRGLLPEAKIVLAVGNNDFGFNLENLNFYKKAVDTFNKANIHVVCANLFDTNTGKYPDWVDPYILIEINHKKFLVTAFCINQIRLNKYGLNLIDIPEAFLKLKETIKHIEPDALVVLNHALEPSSRELIKTANQHGIKIDLLIGGHEHSPVNFDANNRIYYPQAFSKTMLCFNMKFENKQTNLEFIEQVNCKEVKLNPAFEKDIIEYEEKSGLNIPVAKSTLHLEKLYSDPCSLGTFIADIMRNEAKTDIALISTGYTSHALRYEKGKTLTYYNIERAFSADVPIQTTAIHPEELKDIFNNALKLRYIHHSGNVRFLQCSQNITIVSRKSENDMGFVKQIFINGEPLFDENVNALHPDILITCAIDPFIGAGEQGFDVFKPLSKETLMKNNHLVKIKDLFIKNIKEAEQKYIEGSEYPQFKLIDDD